jgi:hypothetical protein
MKLKFILSAIIFMTLYSCKKQETPILEKKYCCFVHTVDLTMNGQNWVRNGWKGGVGVLDDNRDMKDTSILFKCLDGLVTFQVGLVTQEGFSREALNISNVNKKISKYQIRSEHWQDCPTSRDSVQANYTTYGEDGDVVKDLYFEIDRKKINEFEITSYDSLSNAFKCQFDITFIRTRKADVSYPDTMHLKGNFSVSGRLKL